MIFHPHTQVCSIRTGGSLTVRAKGTIVSKGERHGQAQQSSNHRITESGRRDNLKTASKSLKDLRIAEVVELDLQIENGKVTSYRTKLSVSFKYQGKD